MIRRHPDAGKKTQKQNKWARDAEDLPGKDQGEKEVGNLKEK